MEGVTTKITTIIIMRNICPLSNELGTGNLIIDVATSKWVQVCPEGGNEVIWLVRIWDRIRTSVVVILIWKKGQISVAAQEDKVLRYREGVEGKGIFISKINFLPIIIS